MIIVCAYCSKEFRAFPSDHRKYCSRKCYELGKRKNYIKDCPNCGVTYVVNAKGKRRKFCSKECSGQYDNPTGSQTGVLSRTWKGGKFISDDGYEMVLIPGKGTYTTKQKLVMEEYLGRTLTSNEIVHHKDGNKLNNKISNLDLLTRGEHMLYHIHGRQDYLQKEIKK